MGVTYLVSVLVVVAAVLLLAVLGLRLRRPVRRSTAAAKRLRTEFGAGAGTLQQRASALRAEIDRRRGRY